MSTTSIEKITRDPEILLRLYEEIKEKGAACCFWKNINDEETDYEQTYPEEPWQKEDLDEFIQECKGYEIWGIVDNPYYSWDACLWKPEEHTFYRFMSLRGDYLEVTPCFPTGDAVEDKDIDKRLKELDENEQ